MKTGSLHGRVELLQERALKSIYLAGDSTMASKEAREYPEHGWGMMIPDFFNSSIEFINEARNGCSTKSFIREGRWKKILDRLKPGDYVLIQFGYNDEKTEDPARYTAPEGEFRQNLEYFIVSAGEKGAVPVLMTPVCRRKFTEAGELKMTHGAYPDALKSVASKQRVPCIDMEAETAALLRAYGPEKSTELFMHLAPGKYAEHPDGKQDDTHFNAEGARRIAALAADGIRLKVPELAGYLK